jgi:hypothetical protein
MTSSREVQLRYERRNIVFQKNVPFQKVASFPFPIFAPLVYFVGPNSDFRG